jgi:hypothetical protein
LNHLF